MTRPFPVLRFLWQTMFFYVCITSALFVISSGPLGDHDVFYLDGFFDVFLVTGSVAHVILFVLTAAIHVGMRPLPTVERNSLHIPLRWFGVIGIFVFSFPLFVGLLAFLGFFSIG